MAIFLGSSNFSGYNGSHFTASVYLDSYSQDINANRTDYTLHLYAGAIDGYYASGTSINGYLQGNWSGSTTRFPARTQVDMGTYSGSITHNADGTAWLGVTGYVNANIWSGVGEATVSTGWTPPTIPRHASINGNSSATVGKAYSININRLVNNYSYTLRYSITDDNNVTHTNTIAANINQDKYDWTIPEVFYQYWQTSRSKRVNIYCDTYNGSNLIGTTSLNPILNAGLDALPVITSKTFVDENSTTVALTGDNLVMIKGYSIGRLNVMVELPKYGKIDVITQVGKTEAISYTIEESSTDEKQVISFEQTITDFDQTYGFLIWDKRGSHISLGLRKTTDSPFSSSFIEIVYNVINYIPLTLNMTAKRPSATTGEIEVTFSGNYFNDSFGGADNTLELSWKYREKGVDAWTDGGTFTKDTDYTITGNIYESKGAISLGNSFDYKNIYEIIIYYKDKLIDSYTTKTVTKGLPIFWWNKDGVYNGDNKKFLVEGDASGDTLPIGGIIDYDGTTVPDGYEEVTSMSITDGGNAWKKVDFGTYRLYWKYVTYTYTYTANGWGEISFTGTYNKLPSGITFDKDKMIFNGTASCGDHAIEQSVGIYNNNTNFWVGWQNKYSGAVNNATTVLNIILIDFS